MTNSNQDGGINAVTVGGPFSGLTFWLKDGRDNIKIPLREPVSFIPGKGFESVAVAVKVVEYRLTGERDPGGFWIMREVDVSGRLRL